MPRKVGILELLHINSGDWIRPVHRGFVHACCDCGEVQIMEFRIIKLKKGGQAVEFRTYRHDGKTDELRRDIEMQYKISEMAYELALKNISLRRDFNVVLEDVRKQKEERAARRAARAKKAKRKPPVRRKRLPVTRVIRKSQIRKRIPR
jgi:hypothetical protein